jgi:hypothetical protein
MTRLTNKSGVRGAESGDHNGRPYSGTVDDSRLQG